MKGVKTTLKITNNMVSLPYTKDNPLVYTNNKKAQGYRRYDSLCTLEKGKKYLFCVNCDGTLGVNANDGSQDYTTKPFTLWLSNSIYTRYNLFSSAGTRYIWQLTWNTTTENVFLWGHTYSDDIHDTTIHVWDIAIYKISE